MTSLGERRVELRRHLDDLKALRPRVMRPESLERDLSLRNGALFSACAPAQDWGNLRVSSLERPVDIQASHRAVREDPPEIRRR